MKTFTVKLTAFVLATILFYLFLLLLLPTTLRTSKTLLFAEIKKDSLLANEISPRIIFVGGSNISFGLNSQLIKDSLRMNPVNTGIHASLGLKYMLDNSLLYIKKGDVVVLISEYQHFYREYDFGSEELIRTVLDVNKSKIPLLSLKQIYNCLLFSGNVVLSKFNPREYINVKEDEIYGVNSFNNYGDVYTHWYLERRKFDPAGATDTNTYNPDIMNAIKEYELKIRQKGANLFISYPGYQDISFRNSKDAITKVESEYKKAGFIILGSPERYMMDDSLMFDTPNHLCKKGVDIRTGLLISDLKSAIENH
jgi:hypothetical protein